MTTIDRAGLAEWYLEKLRIVAAAGDRIDRLDIRNDKGEWLAASMVLQWAVATIAAALRKPDQKGEAGKLPSEEDRQALERVFRLARSATVNLSRDIFHQNEDDYLTLRALLSPAQPHDVPAGNETEDADPSKAYDALKADVPAGENGDEGWRDIVSAPRDGTSILAYGEWESEAVVVAWWDGYRPGWAAVYEGLRVIEHQGDFGTEYKEPGILTHWMPLPTIPSRASRSTSGRA